MNKTTEALLARIEKLEAANKLAEEAFNYRCTPMSNYSVQTSIAKEKKALAAIREVLAESKPAPDGRIPKTVFTLDDISKAAEIGRQAGMIDALAEPVIEHSVEVGYVGEFVAPTESLPAGTPLCVAPAQPVKQEHSEQYWLHEINNARATGYEKGRASCKHDERMLELGVPVQPVKQEPVAILKSSKANFERQFGKQAFADWVYDDLTYSFENAAIVQQTEQEPVACQFPRQPNNEGGWTIEAKFLNALVKDMADDEFAVGMEETEAVLLALERIYAAPVSAKREWVDLTDYEIVRLYAESPMCDSEMIAFARAVIAAFKEKNK